MKKIIYRRALRIAAWQDAYGAMQKALAALDGEQQEKAKAAVQAQIGQWT